MTKDDLITNCTMKLGRIPRNEVHVAIDAILEIMSLTLAENGRIEIRGFGSFNLHHSKAKIGRNPKSGVPCNVAAKRRPHFKPGKELRERVNGGKYIKGLVYE